MTPNDNDFEDRPDDHRREDKPERERPPENAGEFFEVGGGRGDDFSRDESRPAERPARDRGEEGPERDRGADRPDSGGPPAAPVEGGDRGGRPRDDQRRDRRDRRHRRDRDRRGGAAGAPPQADAAPRDGGNREAGRDGGHRDSGREGGHRESGRDGGNREPGREGGNRESGRESGREGGHRDAGRDGGNREPVRDGAAREASGREGRREGGGRRDEAGRRDGGRRDDRGRREGGRRDESGRRDDGAGRRADAPRGDAPRTETPRAERHDRGDDRRDDRRDERGSDPDERDLRVIDVHDDGVRHDGDGADHGRGGPGIVRDVTRAGRHEPTPDELMPDDEPRQKPEPEDEPEGKPWELLDSEFGDGEDRGANGPGGGRRRRRDRFDRGRREVEELGAGTSGIDVLDPPRDDRERRRRGVEPGLTLRDLIPFLRPPRHVVVAGCGTGAGHARVAHAVVESMKAADRNAVLREVDILDLLTPEFRAGYVRSVLDELSRRPALYGRPFETGSPSTYDQLPEDLDPFLLEAFGEKFRGAFIEKRPDVIVLTHWLPLKKFEADLASGVTLPKIVVVAGEPDFHRYWYSPVVKQWIVANVDFERRLLAAGAPAGSIHVVGTPVGAAFGEDVDRDAVRREHGLRREATTVLFRPGGAGSAERIVALCERALASAGPLNLLVVVGKNDRLREDLERLAVPENSVLRAFGFVDKIHELMAVSDLLVTRATAHTAAEAAATALPMLLLRPTPGAEERLADRLLMSGAAMIARDDEQFESELVDLCKNRRRLQAMRDRARQADRPDNAGRAAERLLRVLR